MLDIQAPGIALDGGNLLVQVPVVEVLNIQGLGDPGQLDNLARVPGDVDLKLEQADGLDIQVPGIVELGFQVLVAAVTDIQGPVAAVVAGDHIQVPAAALDML